MSLQIQPEGQLRISPIDSRGTPIPLEILTVACEISGRAFQYANKALGDPAVAASLLEDSAAAVSRVVHHQSQTGNVTIKNLHGYLFRAFVRRIKRVKQRELPLLAHDPRELVKFQTVNPLQELELHLLVDNVLTRCDAFTREMFERRVQGYSWREIGEAYGISAHAAESRYSQALRRVRRELRSGERL